MTALALAWMMIARPGHARSASVLGEWHAWRITSGDILVNPPKLVNGTLILKANGTFTSHIGELPFYEAGAKGTYRIHGNRIILKGTSWSSIDGRKRHSEQFSLLRRDGQLWEMEYLLGGGSYIYIRPGKRPAMPRSERDWPSFADFLPAR